MQSTIDRIEELLMSLASGHPLSVQLGASVDWERLKKELREFNGSTLGRLEDMRVHSSLFHNT